MIDTAIIKKRILDLAFQGKLVEQRENEGTGTDLYLSIQEQKECLIKEGKIKKEKSLPEISQDEKPFEIPKTWVWVRLRDICTKIVDGDHNPPAGIKDKTEYLMISAQNIINDKLDNMENVRYLSEEVFLEENKRTMLEIDDVLLTIVGTLGRSCVYRGGYNLSFQRSVSVITTLVNSDYLKYVFDSGYIQRYMEQNATGAAQLGFYLNKVEKLVIPLPPLEEQKRISEKILSLYEQISIIDTLQQQYSLNLEILKTKIIDAGIQGNLTEHLPEDGTAEELLEQIAEEKKLLIKEKKIKTTKALPGITEEEIPFEIPDNWKWVRLGNLIQIKSGDGLVRNDMVDGDIPVYGGNGISGYHNEWNVDKRTVVIGRVGVNCGSIHITEEKSWVTDNAFITMYPEKNVNQEYLAICLKYLELGKRQTATAQPVISGTKIYPIPFPLPPLAEQKRIAERINELLSILD